MVFYPTIPWMGIAGLGMVLGRMLKSHRAGVARGLCISGAGALVLFAFIRLLDGFGNFHRAESGWIGFFNLTKYPPDLTFLLLTTGIDLLLLQLGMRLERSMPSGVLIMAVFGSSPLLFYITHLYLWPSLHRAMLQASFRQPPLPYLLAVFRIKIFRIEAELADDIR
jgi:uncharacterized membrane protein